MKARLICIMLLTVVAAGMLFSCDAAEENSSNETTSITIKEGTQMKLEEYDTKNPVVAMTIKDYGTVVIELYPEIAPNTVNNFISLVLKGFYDNNTFHRCYKDFMLQGGDPTGKGTGDPGYKIKGEFNKNGFKNDLKHTKGVLSMARTGDMNGGGCQFFIMADDAPHLDNEYCAFGKVIDGIEVVDLINEEVSISTNNGVIAEPLVLEKCVIDLKGKTYPQPETISTGKN